MAMPITYCKVNHWMQREAIAMKSQQTGVKDHHGNEKGIPAQPGSFSASMPGRSLTFTPPIVFLRKVTAVLPETY